MPATFRRHWPPDLFGSECRLWLQDRAIDLVAGTIDTLHDVSAEGNDMSPSSSMVPDAELQYIELDGVGDSFARNTGVSGFAAGVEAYTWSVLQFDAGGTMTVFACDDGADDVLVMRRSGGYLQVFVGDTMFVQQPLPINQPVLVEAWLADDQVHCAVNHEHVVSGSPSSGSALLPAAISRLWVGQDTGGGDLLEGRWYETGFVTRAPTDLERDRIWDRAQAIVTVPAWTPPEYAVEDPRSLDADLHHWWRTPADPDPTLVLNGSLVTRLYDVREVDFSASADYAYFDQSDPGVQPTYASSGFGPNSVPYINVHASPRRLASTSLGHAAGNRLTWIVVGALRHSGSGRIFFEVCDESDNGVVVFRTITGPQHRVGLRFDSDGPENVDVTSPSYDEDDHVWMQAPYASGAQLQIDGADTTPQPTSNDSMAAMETAYIGAFSAFTFGQWAEAFCVENMTADRWANTFAPYLNDRYGYDL